MRWQEEDHGFFSVLGQKVKARSLQKRLTPWQLSKSALAAAWGFE
jgi:site-specific recombinase XerC